MAQILLHTSNLRPGDELQDMLCVAEDGHVFGAGDLASGTVIQIPGFTVEEVELALDSIANHGVDPKFRWNYDQLTAADFEFIEDSAANNKIQRINRLKNKVREKTS
jgi:hypothetical protein